MWLSAPAHAQATGSVKPARLLGCADRSDTERAVRFVLDDDKEAFMRFASHAVEAGRCILFQQRESVYIVESPLFSSIIKIRRKGDPKEYWTASGGIDAH